MLSLGIALTQALVSGASVAQNPSCPATTGQNLPGCYEGGTVLTWNCWQKTMLRTSIDPTTYANLRLKVTFTRVGFPIKSFSNYAFWDGTQNGRDRVRVRAMFPSAGTWRWALSCEGGPCGTGSGLTTNDFTLEQRTVTVSTYNPSTHGGSNALFEKGRLKQAVVIGPWPQTAKTYTDPAYNSGETFLWHGDTAWAAPMRATPSEWKTYVANRSSRGFTLVQVGIAPDWTGGCNESITGSQGVPAFDDQPSGAACAVATDEAWIFDDDSDLESLLAGTVYPNAASKIRPDFFERFDRFVQQANCRGLVVLVAGIAEPVNRYPEEIHATAFARNLAARLSGNHVLLSPGFDDRIDAECDAGGEPVDPPSKGVTELLAAVGEAIDATTTNLLVNHFGTNGSNTSQNVAVTGRRVCQFKDYGWNALNLYQSGKNGSATDASLSRVTERPRGVGLALQDLETSIPGFDDPRRPAVNGEAIYDYGKAPATVDGEPSFSRYRARQAAYLSWFSGATGYTFGAAGIWDWGLCGNNPPPGGAPDWCGLDVPNAEDPFKSYNLAMGQPSSDDMELLESYLRGILFGQLVVEHWRIDNQPSAQDKKMALARDPDRLLAYLPHNDFIDVDLNGTSYFTTGVWVPTRSEDHRSPVAAGEPIGGGTYRYEIPDLPANVLGEEDWALLLMRDSGSSAARGEAVASDGEGLFFERDRSTGTWWAKLGDPAARDSRVVFESRSALPPVYELTSRDDGRRIVAWIDSAPETNSDSARIRWESVSGTEWGEAQLLSSSQAVRIRSLGIARDARGQHLVYWNEDGASGSRVLARQVDPERGLLGEPVTVASGEPSQLGTVRAGCDSRGSCLVAFERRLSDRDGTVVAARRLDLDSLGVREETTLDEVSVADCWIESVVSPEPGLFQVAWERILGGQSRGRAAATVADSAGGLRLLE